MHEISAADFRWDEYFWRATVSLPSWRGFQSRGGPYGSRDREAPSEGMVDVVFAPEGRDDAPLREAEVGLVRWAIAHEREMQQALLDRLLATYESLRRKYERFLGDPAQMPPVSERDGFRPLLGLTAMNVHPIEDRGPPYVGFELGCTWDSEHGLGVLMHGTRVVEIGGADTAILLWIARRDAAAGDPGPPDARR